MSNFQFAQNLVTQRQLLQLTQEDIAAYVGVSRAAVSKWEKGLSYPDISLLPKLATFFNLSIDTLLGYEPQMTPQRIEAVYMEFAQRLSKEPFEIVHADLQKIKMEYFSCYPLLVKIAQLYINYYSKAPNSSELLEEAIELTERVRQFDDSLTNVKEAVALQALVYIMQNNSEATLALIGYEPEIDYGTEQLMITAYSMQGNTEKAKEITQVSMFQKLLGLLTVSIENIMLNIDEPQHFEQTIHRIHQMMNVYNVNRLHVNTALVFYLKAAMGYMLLKQEEKALQMLENYTVTCENAEFPLKLNGDEYFHRLKNWISNQPQIMTQAPRDEQSIKADFYKAMHNPIFEPLNQHSLFKQLLKRLKKLEEA